jgi:hypothetical protein
VIRRRVVECRSCGGRRVAPVLIVMLALSAGVGVASPIAPPATAGGQVFVSGVSDAFPAVRAAVARAAQETGRTYRVIVVDSAGDSGDARGLLDRIVEGWRDEARGPGRFDPANDVTIVLAVKDRRLAMDVPWSLEVSSGLDPKALEQQLIAKAFVPRAKDGLYDEGLADLVTATERWVADTAAAKARRAQALHTFRTQTLPYGLAGLAGIATLGGFLAQRARHRSRLRAAREKLATFKSEVVALSDLLDAEQERHRMLPHTDPDFQTPMEGQTRAAYDHVQGSIRRYRERWLALMDVWEKAENVVSAEWFLGTARAEEAIALLDSAAARPPLDAVAGECRGPLDMLEQAHETARARLQEVAAATTATDERLAVLGRRGRSAAAFQLPLTEVMRARTFAAAEVESDPVAARGRLEESAAVLARINEQLDALEASDDRRQRAVRHADEIETLIRGLRAEGWLLTEHGANPDDRVAAARQECRLAEQLLDAAEPTAAAVHVERAEGTNAEAVALLESIRAARARAEELLPVCVARAEALSGRREAALRGLEHLAQAYAESSWSDVADNAVKADEGIAHAAQLIADARAALDPARQEYFRAVALLEETVRQEDWIEGCQAAIGDRRAELDELRASLPGRRDSVQERVVALERRLHRQQTDRARATERCREAARLVEVAGTGMVAPRPDLRQVAHVLDAAVGAADRAEQHADEDERLARQASADLEETEAVLRRAAAWYAEGVQADVRGATAMLETATSLLQRQRYEEAIHTAGEAAQAARAAYAAATAEAERRRLRRQQDIQRRQMAEAFSRMTRGAGPWVIQLPGGQFTGPDPWRSLQGSLRRSAGPVSRSAGGGWSRDIAQVGW